MSDLELREGRREGRREGGREGGRDDEFFFPAFFSFSASASCSLRRDFPAVSE